MTSRRVGTRIGWSLKGLAVAGAALITMVPTLTGSAGYYVYLYDNGQCVISDIIGMNGTGLKSMPWTPLTAGTHTLQFRDGWSVKTLTVTVEPAPPGAPAPSPRHGCGSTGSIG
ncbi:hypothetical protein [Nocardia heshunensis]